MNAGLDPDEAKKRLDLSEEAYRQHMIRIQGISDAWLDYLSQSGYFLSYKKDLMDVLANRKRLENLLKRIEKNLKKNPNDTKIGYLEVQTIAQLDKNITLHWELLGHAPMVGSFRKFIQDDINAKVKHFNGEKQKDGIPQYSISFLP